MDAYWEPYMTHLQVTGSATSLTTTTVHIYLLCDKFVGEN